MSIFDDYLCNISLAMGVFVVEKPRSEAYINGLISKFGLLKMYADEELMRASKTQYPDSSVLDDFIPRTPILLPYLDGIIDEITKIASKETIRMQEIKETSNIAEAMLQTFGEQYTMDGDINELLREVNIAFLDAWRNHDLGSLTTDVDKQLAYEFNDFARRLPQACWSEFDRVFGK